MLQYGSDNLALVSNTQRTEWRNWSSMVFAGIAILVSFGYAGILHSTIHEQVASIAQLSLQLNNIYAENPFNKPATYTPPSEPAYIPHKYSIKYATPLKTQDFRGTCWAFAAVGVLEQTYRSQGIANGYLAPNEYLALSEQAYGAETLRLCQLNAKNTDACLIPGSGIWQNSTEGGASEELYYLYDQLKENIFPESICPYIPQDGQDTLCPDLNKENRETNPLLFHVKDTMDTYYDIYSVKNALVKYENHAMALTTAIPYITHYYPCIGALLSTDPRCNMTSSSCTLCPSDLAMATCCIPLKSGENYNMDGEFIAHRGMTLEGGHVMTLVGYNDKFRTRNGYTGGFIIKNSWFDGVDPPLGPPHARGSHSLKYWMQEISDYEERIMCPNSQSPYSWYQCGNSQAITHSKAYPGDIPITKAKPIIQKYPLPFKRSNAFQEGIQACLSNETKMYAENSLQPLELKCTNNLYCNQSASDDYVYFVRNMTEWGDTMQRMCLFEYNYKTNVSSELCLPPLLVSEIAYLFTPKDSNKYMKKNDKDHCGYYFLPYQVIMEYVTLFQGFSVNHFHIKWADQSYPKNQHKYKHLDYAFVEKSTKKQSQYKLPGPFPFVRSTK